MIDRIQKANRMSPRVRQLIISNQLADKHGSVDILLSFGKLRQCLSSATLTDRWVNIKTCRGCRCDTKHLPTQA